MTTAKDYTTELFALMEKRDSLVPEFARRKALHDKSKELRTIKISVLMSADSESRSNAEKEMRAYASKDYRDYINTLFREDVEFYKVDATIDGIDQRIDVLRTLISFEKTMINLTQ